MLGLAALAVAPVAGGGAASPCADPRIGFLGPLTGPASFIGKEQVGFARYAIRSFAKGRIRLVERDTALEPARAASAAKALRGASNVLAVVGPAGNQEVLAAAPAFNRVPRVPFISGSATHPALTNGSIPSFFRVVPNDQAQAPAVVRLLRELKARLVVIVDDRSAYSTALAARVRVRLGAAGVRVVRRSVRQADKEFSSTVEALPAGTDAVFLPWQIAASAQVFGFQLRRAGSTAALVGSDALDSGDFRIRGAYVTGFAPDVRQLPASAELVRGYGFPIRSLFGPPLHLATEAAIRAIDRACADGRADRAEVTRHLRATAIPRTILGGPLRFTPRGDRKGATFSVFRLDAAGRKVLVG